MTEDEAKEKWCPMKRIVPNSEGYSSGNVFEGFNNSPLDNQCMCIGSNCMMWTVDAEPPITGSTHGHCGLAK